jgi:adenine-specific DNA-methyltransferase
MSSQRTAITAETVPTLERRLRDLRAIAARFARSKMTPLQVCRAALSGRLLDKDARTFFSALPEEEKHYWIASLYALLMPKARRRKLAAYFTPPHLSRHAIDILIDEGVVPGKSRILDPASGGAAFLVPLAARIADKHRSRGARAETALRAIESTLAGIEIEPDLGALSRLLLSDLLRPQIQRTERRLNVGVRTADTLSLEAPPSLYDAIIGNPPYGRVFRPSKKRLKEFAPVITDGYVNLYALFIEQALRWARPGGLICLVVPMSFVGGPHFAALRKRILETTHVLRLDPIDKRSDVFMDVLYDVCVLVLRKRNGRELPGRASSSLIQIDQEPHLLGYLDLPSAPTDRVWALPDGAQNDRLFHQGLSTLEDYGYIAKTGYFVWNREQHRYRAGFTPRSTEVPLYWAHNVRPNATCVPQDGGDDPERIGFVRVETAKAAVIGTDAIVLQRTSNRRQKRRLIAALVRQSKVPGGRGFLSENHTILLLPNPNRKQVLPLRMLCRLLNTHAVDARFRRMSGSVSVSTKALRSLPLPSPTAVRAKFTRGLTDDEAAEAAYELSIDAHKTQRRQRRPGAAR